MADRFYGVSRGQQIPSLVLEGAATTGRVIELRVNDTVYAKCLDVILGLEAILKYLQTKETTPIA